MTIAGLDHINISTPRLEETRAFFVEVLGLVEGDRPAIPVPGHWLYAGRQPIVHLMQARGDGAVSDAAALDHVAFAIDDYDALRARLESRDVPYSELPFMADGLRQMTVHDPNGIKIELTWRRAPAG